MLIFWILTLLLLIFYLLWVIVYIGNKYLHMEVYDDKERFWIHYC